MNLVHSKAVSKPLVGIEEGIEREGKGRDGTGRKGKEGKERGRNGRGGEGRKRREGVGPLTEIPGSSPGRSLLKSALKHSFF